MHCARLSFTRRRSSLQRKLSHVGWCSTGPTPLTRATRNGRWTSDWMSWAGQDGTEAQIRRLDPAGPTPPLAATRIRTLDRVGCAPPGPRHRSWPPGYGRSTASAGACRAHATGRGYPDTDAQLRQLVPAEHRPPVAATRMAKPGGLVTKDHGPASPYPDRSPDS